MFTPFKGLAELKYWGLKPPPLAFPKQGLNRVFDIVE